MSSRRDIENLSFLYRPDMDGWQCEEWERQRADAEYDMNKNEIKQSAPIQYSDLLNCCSVIADECEREEESSTSENEKLWMRAYAAGARRLLHDIQFRRRPDLFRDNQKIEKEHKA